MKQFLLGLVLAPFLIVAVALALLISGCSRGSDGLIAQVTSDAPKVFLSYKINGGPVTDIPISDVPYEKTFDVKPGDAIQFAAGSKDLSGNPVNGHLKITFFYNGQEVASAVESNVAPSVTSILGASPIGVKEVFMASCAYSIPNSP